MAKFLIKCFKNDSFVSLINSVKSFLLAKKCLSYFQIFFRHFSIQRQNSNFVRFLFQLFNCQSLHLQRMYIIVVVIHFSANIIANLHNSMIIAPTIGSSAPLLIHFKYRAWHFLLMQVALAFTFSACMQ